MKRCFAIWLALALCLSLLPGGVSAQAVENLLYEINDGEVTILGHQAEPTGELVIPGTVEGYPVTVIGKEAFAHCVGITGLTIPEGVRRIEQGAFFDCYSLESVTIPNGVTFIGDAAFCSCEQLTAVTIPKSVLSMGAAAFADCPGLSGIWVAEDNPVYENDRFGALYTKDGRTLLEVPGSFSGYYTVADGTEIIGKQAFAYCGGLTGVFIPDSVVRIGEHGFYDCENLIELSLPASVTAIGFSAFSGCDQLCFQVYDNCQYYACGDDPYYFLIRATDPDMTQCTIHPQTKVIADCGFYCCSDVTQVTVPEGVRNIGNFAFAWCHKLMTVTIPKSVTTIGAYAFEDCGIKTVYFAGDAPDCEKSMFAGVRATVFYHRGTSGWERVDVSDPDDHRSGIILEETEHICPAYFYDGNHTCTEDGTERAVCLSCGETVIRRVNGTAAHRYSGGVCTLCGHEDAEALVCSLSVRLDECVQTQLTLTAVGESTPAFTVFLPAGHGCNFETVGEFAAGGYTLTVRKEGFVPRTYSVTLVPGENKLDLELRRPGELTGDGKLTVCDVARLYAHIKGTAPITDDYLKRCADLTGDSRLNLGDVACLLAEVR